MNLMRFLSCMNVPSTEGDMKIQYGNLPGLWGVFRAIHVSVLRILSFHNSSDFPIVRANTQVFLPLAENVFFHTFRGCLG